MAKIQHVGKWSDRLKPDRQNPREVVFARAWKEENKGCTLDTLIERRASQQEATDVATVIQWLGTNVGWSFLNKAVDKCGFRIVGKAKGR